MSIGGVVLNRGERMCQRGSVGVNVKGIRGFDNR